MTALNGATIHGRQLRSLRLLEYKLLKYPFLRVFRVGKVVNKREDHEDNSDTHGIPSVHVSYISYQVQIHNNNICFSSKSTISY